MAFAGASLQTNNTAELSGIIEAHQQPRKNVRLALTSQQLFFFCKHSYLFLLQYATTKGTDGTWSSEFADHAAALGALVNVSIHIFNSRWLLPCVLIRPTLSAATTLLTSSHHSQFVPCFHTVVHTLASACFVPWPLCFFIGALISFDV